MSKKKEIPVFDIDEIHEVINNDHRSHISGFDIISIDSLSPSTVISMPPFRQGFYLISLTRTGKTRINVNTRDTTLDNQLLWFVVPGQVFSWVRDPSFEGYHLLFTEEFVRSTIPDLQAEFPFLRFSENSIFHTTDQEQRWLELDMERMLSVFQNPHPYQEKVLEGMVVSMLYNSKSIYERFKTSENQLSRGQVLTQKFRQLVNKLYIDSKNVGDYAERLSVTPNYLTTTVKQNTGKTPKDIIQNRVFLESKNMLAYSTLDISEIAYQLNFQEPTHFTRFFRKFSGTTPNKFRKAQ